MGDSQNQGTQDPKENLEPSEEELKSEEEALKDASHEEVRAQILERLGVERDEMDSDILDKLVDDKLAEKKNLSTAIRQKINYREKVKAQIPKEEQEKEDKPQSAETEVEKLINQKFEQKNLESLDLSDELKKEVQDYAGLKGISIKEAFNSPYIQFRKEEVEKQERIDGASIGSKHRAQTSRDFSEVNPLDIDTSTPEGKKEYAAYKEWLKNQP